MKIQLNLQFSLNISLYILGGREGRRGREGERERERERGREGEGERLEALAVLVDNNHRSLQLLSRATQTRNSKIYKPKLHLGLTMSINKFLEEFNHIYHADP